MADTAPWDDEPKKTTEAPPWADDAQGSSSGTGSGEKKPWDDDPALKDGVDYLAKGGATKKEELPSAFSSLTDLVTRPSDAMQTFVSDITDKPSDPKAAWDHAVEQFHRPGDKHPPHLYSDKIKAQMKAVGTPDSVANPASSVVGGALGVVTDPMNVATEAVGGVAKGIKGISDAVSLGKGLGPDAMAATNEAAKAGYMDKAIGLLTSTRGSDIAAYRADPELMKRAEPVANLLQEFDKHHYEMGNTLVDKKRKLQDATNLSDQAVTQFLAEHSPEAHLPSQWAPEVKAAMEHLDEETKRQDSEAYDMLDAKGVTVPKTQVLAAIKGPISDFARTPKVTGAGIAGKNELVQVYNNVLSKFGPTMTGEQIKDVVKEIQQSAGYADGIAARDPKLDQALQRMGGSLHGILKGDPEYDKLMGQLASDTKLLSQARAVYGNEMTLPGRLDGLHRPAAAPSLDVLQNLGDRVGLDFGKRIDNYKGAVALKGNPQMQQQLIESSVPEYQAMRQAEQEHNMTKAMIDQLSPTSPGQNEAFIGRMISPRAEDANKLIRDKQTLDLFDSMRGTNMAQKLNDTRIQTALNKGRANGSANTNMWKGIGGAVGAGVGGMVGGGNMEGAALAGAGGIVGRATGGMIGRAVDNNGGAIARKVVDFQSGIWNGTKAAGTVLSQVITGPTMAVKYPAIGAEIMRQLNEHVMNPTPGPQKIVIQDPKSLRDFLALAASDNSISSEDRAKMFTQLQKTGVLTIDMPPAPAHPEVSPASLPPPVNPMGTLKGILGNVLGG